MWTHKVGENHQLASAPVQDSQPLAAPLSVLVDQWVDERIITSDQAARMLSAADPSAQTVRSATPDHAHRNSLIVEAVAYLGGVIVVAGTMLIAGRYWGELHDAWRLSIVGAATLALLAAGLAVPDALGDVSDRLRSVLWLGSTAAGVGFMAVLAMDFLDLHGKDALVFVATGAAVLSAGFWFAHHELLQQFALMVALACTASAWIAQANVDDSVPGLGAWAVGIGWALLGGRGLLEPRWFAMACGSAMAIIGAMSTSSSDAGTVLVLVTVIAVILAGMGLRNLVLLGIGSLGLLVNLPAAITRWFPDSEVVPYVLLAVGVVVVTAALWVGRRAASSGTRKETGN